MTPKRPISLVSAQVRAWEQDMGMCMGAQAWVQAQDGHVVEHDEGHHPQDLFSTH